MEQLNLSDKTILVAEDEISNFLFLKELLEDTKATIIWSKNGQEVIDKIINESKHVDLVLMDIKMPEMSGLEATKILKGHNPGMPIIAQTAYAMQEEKEKCLEEGCDDYIAKPIDVGDFMGLIKKYLVAK